MIDLRFDWAWLVIQSTVLAAIMWGSFSRAHNRNLYAILVPAAFLILMQGQARWVFIQMEARPGSQLTHLHNAFDLAAARRANLYIGLGVFAYAAAFFAFSPRRRSTRAADVVPLSSSASLAVPEVHAVAYTAVGICLVVFGAILVQQGGGLASTIEQPGRNIAGQTVFLLGVGIGKFPLLHKLAHRQRLKVVDVGFWLVSTTVTLFNSRFLAAFAVLQLVMVLNYCRKEISRRAIVLLIVPAVGIFLVFGLYRDYAFRFDTQGPTEAIHFFVSHPDERDVIGWFYRTNVEGFTGVAGVIAHERQTGGLAYDFGMSDLSVFTNFIPNAIRTNRALPFAFISDTLRDAYPYTASVVPSGPEQAYGHMGLSGMIAYCGLLGALTRLFHRRADLPGPRRLGTIVLSVQLLNGVRASLFFSLLFFGLGDILMLRLFRFFLRLPGKVPPTRPAVPVPPRICYGS